jgi:shikimate dehydrogenase
MTGSSALVGLVGANIMKSLSPVLHEDAFAAAGMRGHYHLLDLDRLPGRKLEQVIVAAKVAGFAGLNVTFPCKQAVMPLLDEITSEAREIGAVNTITIAKDGVTTGHNTDRIGFRRGLEEVFGQAAVAGKPVLLVGAGGAGRAVGCALIDLGASIVLVHDTDRARAMTLVADMMLLYGAGRFNLTEDLEAAVAEAAGIVNATPVGMYGFPGNPVACRTLLRSHWVADIIYSPMETELIRAARARGSAVLTGGGMCVHQAAESFRLFTGVTPDIARMHRVFERALAARDAALASVT